MRRTPILVLLSVLVGPINLLRADASTPRPVTDYRARFEEVARSGDDTQVDAVVAEWKTAEPKNPQVYVAVANYYFGKAHQERVQVSTKPPNGEEDFAVSDPKSGAVVGSLSPTVEIVPAIAKRAIDSLAEATRRFPDRMDIWFGLAHVQQELGDFEAQYAALAAALKHATAKPKGLQWRDGEPIADPSDFIPRTTQGYVMFYFRRETPADDERFLRLAKLVAGAYPKHPYPVNAIAGYYAVHDQWADALPYLERAHELDPRDPLITLNLGVVHSNLHNDAKARTYFQDVINSDADQELRDDAQQRLGELPG